MTRVVGYIRVSTTEQASEGVSLAAQRRRLEAQAVASDLELVAVHEDAGASAKSLERPGLRAALADLDAGRADGLLIMKLDRLTRSVKDLGWLLDTYFTRRFTLMSVSDSIDTRSAGGRMVLNVLTSIAQWEREVIAERTSEALAELKAQGRRLGAPALEEPATVARIAQLRDEGLTLADICVTLTHEGIKTQRGGQWHPGTVNRVLRRSCHAR